MERREQIMRLVNTQGKTKRHVHIYNGGCDVALGLTTNGKGQWCSTLTVYREPKKSHFKDVNFWLPLFEKETNRVYLTYSNETDGYKVIKNSKSAIGRVQFKNTELEDFLVESDDLHRFEKWVWDNDARLPFIRLD